MRLTSRNYLYFLHRTVTTMNTAGAAFFFPTLTKIAPNMTGYNSLISMNDPVIELIKVKLAEHKDTYEDSNNRDLMDAYWQEILNTSDRHSSFFESEGGNELFLL